MKMDIESLKLIIRECACQAVKDLQKDEMAMPKVKVIRLSTPEIQGGLFPGMHHHDEHAEHSHLDYDKDQGEKAMILGNLSKLADKAQELKALASEVEDNEEWVQEKIAVAASMIDSVYNYLKYTDK
jgi:hypothetical protein